LASATAASNALLERPSLHSSATLAVAREVAMKAVVHSRKRSPRGRRYRRCRLDVVLVTTARVIIILAGGFSGLGLVIMPCLTL